MIRDPRAVFDQLFGEGSTPADRSARRRANASILDFVSGRISQLRGELGADDRARLDGYVENVREIERRIQNVEAHNRSGETREIPEAPVGIPDSYTEHVQMMMDLMAIALQSDLTRVFSFKMSRDVSGRAFPESGCNGGFHSTSHHQEKEASLKEFQKINTYHVGLLPYFLSKLASIKEADRNLLEESLIIYGSPMGDSNLHNHRRLPLIMLGHANGKLKGNHHLKVPDGTSMSNAWLAALQALGVQADKFSDSTGALDLDPVAATTA
jgi:hypothetical protein